MDWIVRAKRSGRWQEVMTSAIPTYGSRPTRACGGEGLKGSDDSLGVVPIERSGTAQASRGVATARITVEPSAAAAYCTPMRGFAIESQDRAPPRFGSQSRLRKWQRKCRFGTLDRSRPIYRRGDAPTAMPNSQQKSSPSNGISAIPEMDFRVVHPRIGLFRNNNFEKSTLFNITTLSYVF